MPIRTNNEPLATSIFKILEARGFKQSAIAKIAGFDPRVFNDMLNGRRVIKACDVPDIATALGVTPNELYGLTQADETKAS